jgi:hypothetical protein
MNAAALGGWIIVDSTVLFLRQIRSGDLKGLKPKFSNHLIAALKRCATQNPNHETGSQCLANHPAG